MQKRESYDLLIVDVQMPGINGNETARQFRKQFPDTVLVFCSGIFIILLYIGTGGNKLAGIIKIVQLMPEMVRLMPN